MIKVDCEQLSPEWFAARAGVATTSSFDRIITATGKLSGQSDEYLFELIAEYITGEKKQGKQTFWMERGINMEEQARSAYEFITDEEIEQVGFVYKDERRLVGCSPDGLIGDHGLEAKCPAPITHISYLLNGVCPKTYIAQVQGSIWICKLDYWAFMSYHPEYEPLIIKVEPDPVFQKALDQIIPAFADRLEEKRNDPRVIEMRESRLAKAT